MNVLRERTLPYEGPPYEFGIWAAIYDDEFDAAGGDEEFDPDSAESGIWVDQA